MGIERLYADGIEQAYQRGLREPAAPVETGFRAGSFLAAGFGGLGTGLLEAGASFMEGVGSYTALGNKRFAEMGAKTADPERAKEVQRGLDAAGRAARMRAQESAPDPQTTHMADQVFHGLTRFGAKAVGSVVAAGPIAGAGLLGSEEANTIYRDLVGRGIDSETALKVAAVQGAISAAGVVLPISGAAMAATTAGKVGATAALVGVGGPGSYVAQETLARDILQRAGYADEAAKHDPTDPLGLAISTLLPAAFGGVALRGALRSTAPMPSVKTEAGMRNAAQFTPEEQAASAEFERSAGNLAELRKEIARQKDPAARQVLEAELAKQTEAAAKAGSGAVAEAVARSPEVVDAARVKVLQETVQKSLPQEPEAYPRLMEAIDEVAAGRTPQVPDFILPAEREANFAAWFGDSKVVDPEGRPMVVYHGTARDFDAFDPSAPRAVQADGSAQGLYFTRYPDDASGYAAGRSGREGANVQPVYVALRNPYEWPATDLPPTIITPAKRAELEAAGYDGIVYKGGDEVVAFRPEQVKSATGNSGRFDPNSPSLTDPLPARTNATRTTQAPYPEAAAPAGGAGTDPPGAADTGRPAADVQAAGVARTMAQTERQIVDTLATERPDMMVTLPGTNEAVPLADAMEMIRAQQALDESDADLVRAAVLCDLSP